ncbi:MAG: hypothetical protein WCJ71_06640 [Candidatus Omnitrophota bacterium]
MALVWNASFAFAADDGLGFQKKVEGKYVTVYESSGLDVASLIQQLDVRPSDEILSGRSASPKNSREETLARMLDTLFLQVSNILDMHINSLKIDIKVCKTTAELSEIYNRLFHASLGGRRSFYVYDYNSIYVSEEAFQLGIIGHEMSHAIISRYFGIPAPVKVQEVLSMYVEYNLKR